MHVTRLESAEAFLQATADFRAADPAMTSVVGSVATGVVAGRRYPAEFWYTIADDDEQVVGCAIRTPPWLLAASPMPEEAAAALARSVGSLDPDVPGVIGPRAVVDAITAGLGKGDVARITMTDLVRVLTSYRPPAVVEGVARPAVEADRDLLVGWMTAFNAEAGLRIADDEHVREGISLQLTQKSLHLWMVGDEPVSFAGHAPLVTTPGGTVGRIGPVYTPPEHRGRGYGTAITAAVTEALQPRCDVIMLFTDASNPTSNGIYGRLGFELVNEVVEVVFD